MSPATSVTTADVAIPPPDVGDFYPAHQVNRAKGMSIQSILGCALLGEIRYKILCGTTLRFSLSDTKSCAQKRAPSPKSALLMS